MFFSFEIDFNNDGKPDNITFMIKRIKVHNMNAIKDPAYRFPGNYGVEKFLELFSGKNHHPPPLNQQYNGLLCLDLLCKLFIFSLFVYFAHQLRNRMLFISF